MRYRLVAPANISSSDTETVTRVGVDAAGSFVVAVGCDEAEDEEDGEVERCPNPNREKGFVCCRGECR